MHALVPLIAARAIDDALSSGLGGLPVAFVVGIISFFTPCILPLVPGYLSFVSGLSAESLEAGESKRRVVVGTALFVLGFAIVFTAFGASATAIGGFFNDNHEVFERVAGVIVVVMGLAFVAPALVRMLGDGDRPLPRALRFLQAERRPLLTRVRPGLAGAFPLGVAFAVGWSPCVGPGLGVILTLALREDSAVRGAGLLFAFSLGFGVWFVLAALAIRRGTAAVAWIRKHQSVLELTGGAFLLVIGVLLLTNKWLDVIAPLRRWTNTFSVPI